jgi:hypothetical protein
LWNDIHTPIPYFFNKQQQSTHQQPYVLLATAHAAEVTQHWPDVTLKLLGQQVGVVGHNARPYVAVLQAAPAAVART